MTIHITSLMGFALQLSTTLPDIGNTRYQIIQYGRRADEEVFNWIICSIICDSDPKKKQNGGRFFVRKTI